MFVLLAVTDWDFVTVDIVGGGVVVDASAASVPLTPNNVFDVICGMLIVFLLSTPAPLCICNADALPSNSLIPLKFEVPSTVFI